MSAKKKLQPFDFDPQVDVANHFIIDVQRAEVRFLETEVGRLQAEPTVLVTLPRHLWKRVESTVAASLRKEYALSTKNSTFRQGQNLMPRMAGREVMVLAWALASMSQRAVEGGESPVVEHVCKNWAALDASTRWWLYTLANTQASTESEGLGFGWKNALYHGLAAKYS